MSEEHSDANAAVDGDAAVDDLAHLLARIAGLRRAVAWDAAAFELPDLNRASQLVQERQPVDPTGAPASQEALDALVAWATRRGVQVAGGLRVVATDGGARVEATESIIAGTPLLQVPIAAMVRTSAIAAEHPTIGPWLHGQALPGPGTLMFWLLVARFGAGAPEPHAAYVAALPGDVPGTALSWPRSPGSHLVAADMGRRFLAGVLQLYCVAHRRLLLTPEDERPLPLEAFTVQRWLWAGAILSSRQTDIGGELALVPVWDLLAHDESLGAETTELEEDTLRCMAGVDLAPGDPAAMFYGHRTPTERWVYGGFVPPGPPDGERARLPFPLPRRAPLRRDKLVWLISDRDRRVEVSVGRGALDEALARARWYALDAEELDHVEISSVADAWGVPLELSDAGEAAARELLHEWLRERAGPPTPEEPFSREHAFVLAAAHARYCGLLEGPDGTRLLDDADAPAVDAFLASQLAAPLMLRANVHSAGLTFSAIRHSGTWVGTFDADALTGVAMHARNGHLVMHAPGDPAALARFAVERSGREVAGLVGGWAQVDAARDALGLADRPTAHDRRHRVYSVALDALEVPEQLANDGITVRQAEGDMWVAEVDGAIVSTAKLTRVAEVARVTDVSTPESMRDRGYARCSIAGALAAARETGATRGMLLVEPDNAAARTAYEAIGFHDNGDHAITVFETAEAC